VASCNDPGWDRSVRKLRGEGGENYEYHVGRKTGFGGGAARRPSPAARSRATPFPGAAGGGILNHGVMAINGSRVTGSTAPADSAGDQGSGGIANNNLAPVNAAAVNGGILSLIFSQISRNTASGQGGGIFEATITQKGPSAGGPLALKFSQVTRNKAPGRHLRRPPAAR
jgi:hypothetical protein